MAAGSYSGLTIADYDDKRPPIVVPPVMSVRQEHGEGRQAGMSPALAALAQGTVRSDPVVGLSVPLGQHPPLQQRVEDLPVQQLVPQLALETLYVAILPRCPGLDVELLGTHTPKPLAHSHGRELRSVVRTGEADHSSGHHQLGKRLDLIGRPYAAVGPDRQAVPGELIHKGQPPNHSAIMEPHLHEVIGPHMVLSCRP